MSFEERLVGAEQECEAFNCAMFARETVDGRDYCSSCARRERRRLEAEQYADDAYVPGSDGRMPEGNQ